MTKSLNRAESHGNHYAFDIELFDEVDKESSKWNTRGRNIIFNITKKNKDKEQWPRLTKDKAKNPHIQIDWGKWVDEDEEEEEGSKGLGGDWDPSQMNDFNMGGYGDQGDSDDEEEEEEEQPHVHGENCSHDHPKPNADLGDLDADEEKKD